MKVFSLSLLFFFCGNLFAQISDSTYIKSVMDYRKETDSSFANAQSSPLTEEHIAGFQGLEYFPVDPKFRVKAKFIRSSGEKPFQMETTTDRKAIYEKYGDLHFIIDSIPYKLEVYQSHRLMNMEEFKDYLFLPFRDYTNGEETYGGGRFIDFSIPSTDSVYIDFNKAYNPYCAYNSRYSCPIPPEQNTLNLRIEAGVKNYNKEH